MTDRKKVRFCPNLHHPLVGLNLDPQSLAYGKIICYACKRADKRNEKLGGRLTWDQMVRLSDSYYLLRTQKEAK